MAYFDDNREAGKGVSEVVTYQVSGDNVIVSVGGGWNAFAAKNNAYQLTGRGILGVPLYSFISGDSTRMYIEALLRSARVLGQTLVRPYRCDSPEMRRYMEMVIQPAGNGLITLEHRLLREEPLARAVSFRVTASGEYYVRCSMCNRLKDAAGWQESDEIGRIDARSSLPVIYGVCPTCLQSIHGKS